MRIKKVKAGDFLKIPIKNGYWSYSHVMDEGRMTFYDFQTSEEMPMDFILKLPTIFCAIVMRYFFNDKIWKIVGYLTLEDNLKKAFIPSSSIRY